MALFFEERDVIPPAGHGRTDMEHEAIFASKHLGHDGEGLLLARVISLALFLVLRPRDLLLGGIKQHSLHPDKKKIHLIVDNARYYKNELIKAYLRKRKCRIKLLFLPACSPNLNFIERLWHFMKKYIIGTKRWDKFKDFEAYIHTFFDDIKDYEQQLRQFVGTEMHLIKLQG